MFYAQLNEQKIVVGVSDLAGEVIQDDMIQIESFDTDLLGKRYEDGSFVEVPLTPEEVEQLELNSVSQDEINAALLLNQQRVLVQEQVIDEAQSLIMLELQKRG